MIGRILMKIPATQMNEFCTRRCRIFFLEITNLKFDTKTSVGVGGWGALICSRVTWLAPTSVIWLAPTLRHSLQCLLIPAVHYPLSQLQLGSILSGFPRIYDSLEAA